MRDDTPQEILDKKAVGQKIQRFRLEKGLSQIQLAERMGEKYNRKSISIYESSNDHMRIGTLFALCDALGVSLEELGPDRLISEQDTLLQEYQALNLSNRETFKALLGYLMSQQEKERKEASDKERESVDKGQTPYEQDAKDEQDSDTPKNSAD